MLASFIKLEYTVCFSKKHCHGIWTVHKDEKINIIELNFDYQREEARNNFDRIIILPRGGHPLGLKFTKLFSHVKIN